MSTTILHVLGSAEREGSSIARIVGELAARLDPAVYSVHACFLGVPGPLLDELRTGGAVVRHIGWERGVRDPIGAWRFFRYLREHDFSIVHQHFGARSVRRLVRGASKARLVIHLHGRIDRAGFTGEVPIAVRG